MSAACCGCRHSVAHVRWPPLPTTLPTTLRLRLDAPHAAGLSSGGRLWVVVVRLGVAGGGGRRVGGGGWWRGVGAAFPAGSHRRCRGCRPRHATPRLATRRWCGCRPHPSRPPGRRPPPLRAALEARLTRGQLAAAAAAADAPDASDAPPITLVSGGPGTGKTRTVCALLSVLLTGRGVSGAARAPLPPPTTAPPPPADLARLWRAAAPWMVGGVDPRDMDGGGGEETGPAQSCTAATVRVRSGGGPPPRVLLAAPSPAALDELVDRIVRGAVVDARGRGAPPPLARVGTVTRATPPHRGVRLPRRPRRRPPDHLRQRPQRCRRRACGSAGRRARRGWHPLLCRLPCGHHPVRPLRRRRHR